MSGHTDIVLDKMLVYALPMPEIRFTSRTHNSNCNGDVTMLKHVSIFAVYKFRVCRGKGSRDTVTHIYPCASKS